MSYCLQRSKRDINAAIFFEMLKGDFEFDENWMIKHLICNRCGMILSQPNRLHRCGHTFCRDCSPPKLRSCPTCSSVVEAVQPDLTASGLISTLRGKCKVENCSFAGTCLFIIGPY